ncbi:hypothetical protein LSH36_33g07044 [Paralvinella palmiformis]|uniref:WHIM2 domain-containing protein n=1 Tax=Paralvinella palmiformis TaxID=53620 RepID=A0AAD9K8C4_9ANNE|nr:hypothetical protein LSH36_33g07044 [Paralvinella palmiformis]
MDLKVPNDGNDVKPDYSNLALSKGDGKDLNEYVNSCKTDLACTLSESGQRMKSTPLKVPVLKSPVVSNLSYRSIDSILRPDIKPVKTLSEMTYTKCNTSSSVIYTSSPNMSHHYLMKDMSVAVSTSNTDLLFHSSKPNFSPWISLLPRQPCDHTSVTGATTDPPSSPDKPIQLQCMPHPFSTPVSNSLCQSFDFSYLMSPINSTASLSDLSFYNISLLSNPLTPTSMLPACGDVDMNSPILMLQRLQRADPAPIPFEMQQSWWKINEVDTLKELMRRLHLRGIRERALQKNIERFMDLACQSITKGKKEGTYMRLLCVLR